MKALVDFEVFLGVIGGVLVAALAIIGWLTKRQDRLEAHTTARLDQLDSKLTELANQTAARHDTGLSDIWQALEQHRIESRRQAADVEKRSSEFRESTLRQLGTIAAVLARVETRLPFDPAASTGD